MIGLKINIDKNSLNSEIFQENRVLGVFKLTYCIVARLNYYYVKANYVDLGWFVEGRKQAGF